MNIDPLGITTTLSNKSRSYRYISLKKLAVKTNADIACLPHTVKTLLENIARRASSADVTHSDIESLARCPKGADTSAAFMQARLLMQEFSGVPAVVDLAAMRSAVARKLRFEDHF